MKKRYIYLLLFGIPGLFVAGIASILLFAALTGVLWLYVFGDRPWPPATETVISILFGLFFFLLWIGLLVLGYQVGRRLEREPALKRSHVLIAAGLTVLFLLVILVQQWSVGNLGPRSDTVLCSEFCARHGYSGSGMPPADSGNRLCSCYDDSGNEALAVPLDHLEFFQPE
jgi:hypothetical protein